MISKISYPLPEKPIYIVNNPERSFVRRLIDYLFKRKRPLGFLSKKFNSSIFDEYSFIKSTYGGGELQIGSECLVFGNFVFECPSGKIEIGKCTFIGTGTILNSMKSISIGNNVLIAEGCTIQDHNSHSINHLERRKDVLLARDRYKGTPSKTKVFSEIGMGSIKIGDDCWVGKNSMILKNATIGARSIIAAGSVVTKSFPEDVMIGGNPAKIIKHINQ